MKKRLVIFSLITLIFVLSIFLTNADQGTHIGDKVKINADGEKTLNSMSLDDFIGLASSYSDTSKDNPGHKASEIWVSVDGSESTLLTALQKIDGLCGSQQITSYSLQGAPSVYHLASEIDINGEDLQTKINNGKFCGNFSYEWVYDSWGSCSQYCEGGIHTRNVWCERIIETIYSIEVESASCYCSESSWFWCSEYSCDLSLSDDSTTTIVEGSSEYDTCCTSNGCDIGCLNDNYDWGIITETTRQTVDGELCNADEKPAEQDSCNTGSCYRWRTGSWGDCKKQGSCREVSYNTYLAPGIQFRNVWCEYTNPDTGATKTVDGSKCSDNKPSKQQDCTINCMGKGCDDCPTGRSVEWRGDRYCTLDYSDEEGRHCCSALQNCGWSRWGGASPNSGPKCYDDSMDYDCWFQIANNV